MRSTKLFGLVLAGGASKRMGEDKSAIIYHQLPQYEHVARLLKKFCGQVFISVNKQQNKTTAFSLLPDRFPSEGPISGMLTALSLYPNVSWITAPIDMPALDENLIAFLLSNRSPVFNITCFADPEGKDPEPLLGVWEPPVFSSIHQFYLNGGRSLRAFIKQHGANLLKAPHPQNLININTPEERADFLKK